MRKRLVIAMVIISMLLISMYFSGCAAATATKSAGKTTAAVTTTASTTEKAQYKWRLAGVMNEASAQHKGSVYFADKVKELTNGKVEITIYPSMQLGDPVEIFDGVREGTLELGVCVAYSNIDPRFNLPLLPYLANDYETADKLIWGDSWIHDTIKETYSDVGIIDVVSMENEFRGISNNKGPIRSPADVKGLSIRDAGFAPYAAFYKAMGASPINIAFSELYTSLQKGVCDGQDNGPVSSFDQKLTEVQKYYTWTRHAICYICVGMNKELYNSLPADIQKIITDVGKEASVRVNNDSRKQYEERLKQIADAGTQVLRFEELTKVEQDAFIEAGTSVWSQFEDEIGKDVIERLYKERGISK